MPKTIVINKTKKSKRNKRVPTYMPNGNRMDEVKYLDYSNPLVTLTDSGTALLMNGCIQALDSVNDRIGRKIVMKRIKVRASAGVQVADLVAGTGYSSDADTIRFLVVYDKQANGGAATYASLMNTSGVFNAPLSMRNVSTLDRYTVLADRTFQICASGPNSFHAEFDFPVNLETRFTSTNNGDITDIISGSLYFMAVDSNFTANLPGVFNVVTRVEFLDP